MHGRAASRVYRGGARQGEKTGEERRVTAREVYQTLGGEKRYDYGYLCRCPCGLHKRGDIHPSLSVKDGRNGRPLLHCFAGGDYRDVVTALRARGLRL
jgi:putative DNA primase/helicase